MDQRGFLRLMWNGSPARLPLAVAALYLVVRYFFPPCATNEAKELVARREYEKLKI